ncbi:MAG: universal stress protein [Dehalococcoidales bacterium]|jgi:nucleotide-binding universal stress UspA family protein
MYKKVVVPLDGSKLAETVLPHLETIARGCNVAEILLVSVTEKITGKFPSAQTLEPDFSEPSVAVGSEQAILVGPNLVFGNAPQTRGVQTHLGKMGKTANDYLHKIDKQLQDKGFIVHTHVLAGHPAEEIIGFAKNQSADLIVMASRGKSGLNRWNMSNIAEKVIRGTDIPVLLVKPKAGFKETRPKRRGVAA